MDRKIYDEILKKTEDLLYKNFKIDESSEAFDLKKLITEWQVHQIELQMQKDELQLTQKSLQEAHDKFQHLYNFAPIGYFTLDKEGSIKEVNLTGAQLLGYNAIELKGTPFINSVLSESQKDFSSHIYQVFNSEGKQRCELKLKRKDSTAIYIQIESEVIRSHSENSGICWTTCTDVSSLKRIEEDLKNAHTAMKNEILERRRAEQQAKESKTYLKSLIENIDIMTAALDCNKSLIVANSKFSNFMKMEVGIDIIIGDNPIEYLSLEKKNRWHLAIDRAMEGETYTWQYENKFPSGKVIIYEAKFAPITKDTEIIGVCILMTEDANR